MTATTPAPAPRRRRLRRLLLWSAAALLLLVLLLAGTVLWLLHSGSGRDLALSRAAPLAGLSWERAEGTLAGPLHLEGVRIALGTSELEIRRLLVDLAPGALTARNVHVTALQAEGATLWLPPAEAEPGTTAAAEPLPELVLPELALPVALRLDDVRVDGFRLARRATPEPLLTIDRLALSGRLARDGTLALEALRVDSPHGVLEGSGTARFAGGRDMDLRFALQGPGPGASATLALAGEADALNAVLALPGDDRLRLVLDGDRWRLDSAISGFDPAPWVTDWERGTLRLQLQAEGEGGRARLGPGQVALGDTAVAIGASSVALEPGRLLLDPLLLSPLAADGQAHGSATLRGSVATDGGASDLALLLDALALPGNEGALSGSGRWSGTPETWQVAFDGTLVHPDARLPVRLQGQGDATSLLLEEFSVAAGGSESLTGSGRVQWDPALAVALDARLAAFDPARFHGDWPGQLSGDLSVEARQVDGDWQATLVLDALRGTLRGRALRGEGRLHWGGTAARTDLRLALGGTRLALTGRAGDALDLELQLQPLLLADLLPDAGGSVAGNVRIEGTRQAPQLRVALEGEALAVAGQQAGQLALEGQFAPDFSRPADLHITASALQLGGMEFTQLEAGIRGQRGDHQLQARLDGEASLELALDGALAAGGDWQGTLQSLRLTLPEQPDWVLRAPAAVAVADGGVSLAPSCLEGPVMTLCAEARGDASAQQAAITLESLPLAALAPLISAGEPVPLALEGQVSGEARLARRGEVLEFDATLDLPEGHVAFVATEARELLSWRDLHLHAATEGEGLVLGAEGTLEDEGRIDLALEGGQPWRDAAAPLAGTLTLSLPRLRVLELFTPHVADPDGHLDARLAVSGSFTQPQLEGEVRVAGLRSEVPALGITLQDSELTARPHADGSLALEGRLDTGGGPLELSGTLRQGEDGLDASIDLSGERVLASDTPLVHALVSPELSLRYGSTQGLSITGTVQVPEARVNLQRVEGSISPSSDVVVMDPAEPADGSGGLPVTAEVAVTLGDAVSLRGMGFDGRISGNLSVSERPGRVTTARGTLNVTGEYTAYGQDLEVVHGRLLYSATPLDNPSLDVRAIRKVREQTVGLNVRGSVRQPDLEIFAEPPLEQAEALSYLVLGRPLNAASSDDGGQLSQAAAAIGGNYLAERLGSRLGFDTFEVGSADGLDSTAFTVGKYLSPKLYVSYGMALFDNGRLLTLRYILSRRFELELESGQENRAGINYTLEH